jgi:hypothetical protein
VFLFSPFGAPQLSRDVPVDAAFLCDKAAVLFLRQKMEQATGIEYYYVAGDKDGR